MSAPVPPNGSTAALAEPHPLAGPLAEAFLGGVEPDPMDFLMLLSELSQLTPADYVTVWSDVITVGTGVTTTPRERAEYSFSAQAQLADAKTLAAKLGEASEKVQRLVMRAIRLQLQNQQRSRVMRARPQVAPTVE